MISSNIAEIVVEISLDSIDDLGAETTEGSVGSDGESDADEEDEEDFSVHREAETIVFTLNWVFIKDSKIRVLIGHAFLVIIT